MAEMERGEVVGGRYRIVGTLGVGGMGAVYRAVQEPLGREVALKVIAPGLASDADAVERFRREAKAASALSHPNIVTVFDFGDDGGTLFIAMELLSGEGLDGVVRRGPTPARRAIPIMRGICAALAEAHAKGIVHRDLKPANVMLTSTSTQHDVVKVVDFGIARIADGGDGRTLTQEGAVVGTPGYVAPELFDGAAPSATTDLYALGVLAYELLCGTTPFPGVTPREVLKAVLFGEPLPLRRFAQDVPSALEGLVLSLLARDPRQRPPNAKAVDDALAGIDPAASLPPLPPLPPLPLASSSSSSPSTQVLTSLTMPLTEQGEAPTPVGPPRHAPPPPITSSSPSPPSPPSPAAPLSMSPSPPSPPSPPITPSPPSPITSFAPSPSPPSPPSPAAPLSMSTSPLAGPRRVSGWGIAAVAAAVVAVVVVVVVRPTLKVGAAVSPAPSPSWPLVEIPAAVFNKSVPVDAVLEAEFAVYGILPVEAGSVLSDERRDEWLAEAKTAARVEHNQSRAAARLLGILRYRPTDADAHRELGNVFLSLEREDASRFHRERFLALAPTSPDRAKVLQAMKHAVTE